MLHHYSIWEIFHKSVFDIRSLDKFLSSEDEFLVPKHVRERLTEETEFEVDSEMPILILRQLPVDLVLGFLK